ncbi:MAG: hypothetical protein J07HX5_00060 [halophilic archaeon J07HX5]|jgi:hypothetical protein|nr:MAG: hypothetical protein J07HX5_00060 [halophilic archaeon J07HX5]
MQEKTDTLRELYLEITDEETLTEPQEESPSRAPVESVDAAVDEDVADIARHDGLDDAVEDLEAVEPTS